MNTSASRPSVRWATIVATVTLVAACAAEAPVAPEGPALLVANTSTDIEGARALATLRRATARYHDLTAATDDGFVFLHRADRECDFRTEAPQALVVEAKTVHIPFL